MKQGVAVELFLLPTTYADVATLGNFVATTGGEIHLFPNYQVRGREGGREGWRGGREGGSGGRGGGRGGREGKGEEGREEESGEVEGRESGDCSFHVYMYTSTVYSTCMC